MSVQHNPNAKKLINNYIAKAPTFAQLICNKLREIIFKAEPSIIEDWKWGPNYYKNGMVCGFFAFKKHVTFTFFNGSTLEDKYKILDAGSSNVHNRSVKFFNVNDIKEKILISYIKQAVKNNQKGVKATQRTIEIPSDFKKLLIKNKLLKSFESMAYTHRKEYILWITEAKKQETRDRRLKLAIEKLKAGLKFS